MSTPLRVPRSPLWLILPAALTVAVLGHWIIDFGAEMWLKYHIDTDVYRQGAAALISGEPIYDQRYDVLGNSLPFTYPPLAALVFVPLTFVALPIAGLILSLATLACLWWVAALALGHLGVRRPLVGACWVLPLLGLLEPVRETVAFGQINVLLMAMVVTDALYQPEKRRSTGVLAGLAAAWKLTPAVFILYFLVRRQYRAAAVMVGSAVVSTLLAAALTPRLSWQYFTQTLSETSRIGSPDYLTNQSILGAVARLTDPATAERVWPVAVIALLALGLAAAWRVRANPLATLSVVSLIGLLASPVSWSHHWVWIVIVAAACLQGSRLLAVAVVALGILAPHWLVGDQAWSWWQQVPGNAYVLAGIVVLVIACAAQKALGAGKTASISEDQVRA